MESIIRFDSKPVLRDPILIEALPGIGNVGKIAGDFLADTLKATGFARIYSMNFPAQVVPDEDCVVSMACNELWHAKLPDGRDAVFLRGGYQASSPEGQFVLAQDVTDIIMPYGPSLVVTLGGYGTGLMADVPHVYGAVTRKELKPDLEKAGTVFNPGQPQAGIIGAAGLLLGFAQMNGVDGFCLMGETSGYFEDHKSALAVVKVLLSYFSIADADTKGLEEKAKKIDELSEQVKAAGSADSSRDDLGYIG
ncbi:proteasome assembly chaperone family protein [Methanomassiliicoccales archaeon LGM-DZ1]|nr:proteasome assembly chaperone family protein [Methanomassiliicoccales archaeon LGM-DZ1]